eukprot:Awhi_evm1s10416
MTESIKAACNTFTLFSASNSACIRSQRSTGRCNLSSQWPTGYKVLCAGASEYICCLYPYCDWEVDANPSPSPSGDEKCLTRSGYEGFEGNRSSQVTEDTCKVFTAFCNWGVDPEAIPTPVEETYDDNIQNRNEAGSLVVTVSKIKMEPGVDSGALCAPCPTPVTCDDKIQNQDEETTCDDGIQNQNEEGTDCDGVCDAYAPLSSCIDAVMIDDEDVDCGGPCALCPTTQEILETWSDGIQNRHEEGTDCGGACSPCFSCSDGVQNGNEEVLVVAMENKTVTKKVFTAVVLVAEETMEAYATCDNGIVNGDEDGIDCGGICGPCFNCNHGLQNVDCNHGLQNVDEESMVELHHIDIFQHYSVVVFKFGNFFVKYYSVNSSVAITNLINSKAVDETDVDCGDSCHLRSSCSDGIQNQEEEGTDCGCTDGIQHDDEEVIDCCGPCAPCSTTRAQRF